MTERLATAIPEAARVLPARLKRDAIGAAQDTIIGLSPAGLAAARCGRSAGCAGVY